MHTTRKINHHLPITFAPQHEMRPPEKRAHVKLLSAPVAIISAALVKEKGIVPKFCISGRVMPTLDAVMPS